MTTLQIPVDERWLLRAGLSVAELAEELTDFILARFEGQIAHIEFR